MIRNWRRRLAARLAPEMAVEAGEMRVEAERATNEKLRWMSAAGEAQERLATAGLTISAYKAETALLRAALVIAREYVQDTSDELGEQLLALAPKSKKRAPLIAVMEAVQADLRKIDAAMAKKHENGKPLTVSA